MKSHSSSVAHTAPDASRRSSSSRRTSWTTCWRLSYPSMARQAPANSSVRVSGMPPPARATSPNMRRTRGFLQTCVRARLFRCCSRAGTCNPGNSCSRKVRASWSPMAIRCIVTVSPARLSSIRARSTASRHSAVRQDRINRELSVLLSCLSTASTALPVPGVAISSSPSTATPQVSGSRASGSSARTSAAACT